MEPTVERWLPVVGWEWNYQVSDQGRVRSLGRTKNGRQFAPRIMTLSPNGSSKRYRKVLLRHPDRWQPVHRLVLEAFVGPCPEGCETMHRNHTPEDNRLENLKWGTRKENADHKEDNGTQPIGSFNPAAKLTEEDIIAIRADNRRQVDIAADYGVCQVQISSIKLRKTWKHVV